MLNELWLDSEPVFLERFLGKSWQKLAKPVGYYSKDSDCVCGSRGTVSHVVLITERHNTYKHSQSSLASKLLVLGLKLCCVEFWHLVIGVM